VNKNREIEGYMRHVIMRGKQLANVTPRSYMCRFIELSMSNNMARKFYIVPNVILPFFKSIDPILTSN
jgi:hypothetical protein